MTNPVRCDVDDVGVVRFWTPAGSRFPTDLRQRWERARHDSLDAHHPAEQVVPLLEQIRCALAHATLSDWACTWTPDLVAAEVLAGQMSMEEALTWLELHPEPALRAAVALALAPLCSARDRSRLLEALVATVPHDGILVSKEAWLESGSQSFPTLHALAEAAPTDRPQLDTFAFNALVDLLPLLTDEERNTLLPVLLTFPEPTRGLHARLTGLPRIAPFLSDDELRGFLEQIARWPMSQWRHITLDPRVQALFGLAPELAARGDIAEALRWARTMPETWSLERTRCLIAIAAHTTDESRPDLFKEVRGLLQTTSSGWYPAVVRSEWARVVAKAGAPEEALAIVAEIEDASFRTWARAILLKDLPAALADTLVHEHLSLEPFEHMMMNSRAEALRSLIVFLAGREHPENALPFLLQYWLTHQYWWETRQGMATVLDACVKAGLGPAMLAQIEQLPNPEDTYLPLSLLAVHLLEPERMQARQRAQARRWPPRSSGLTRAEALLKLAFQVELPARERLFSEAFGAIEQMVRLDADDLDPEDLMVWHHVLATLAVRWPELAPEIQHRFVSHVIACTRPEVLGGGNPSLLCWVAIRASRDDRKRLLRAIVAVDAADPAPTLDQHTPGWIAATFTPNEWRELEPDLRRILEQTDPQVVDLRLNPPMATIPATMEEALSRLHQAVSHTGYGYRAEALERVAPAFATWAPDQQVVLLSNLLWHETRQRSVADLVSDLGVCAPWLRAWGSAFVESVADAILEHEQGSLRLAADESS